MAVDYDVMIIGGSPTGRYAALAAKQLQAKVAIVEPPKGQGASTESALFDLLTPHALTQLTQLTQQLSDVDRFDIHPPDANAAQNWGKSVLWAEAMQWAEGVVSNLEEQNSPSVLATLGVDVIIGTGQFENNRILPLQSTTADSGHAVISLPLALVLPFQRLTNCKTLVILPCQRFGSR